MTGKSPAVILVPFFGVLVGAGLLFGICPVRKKAANMNIVDALGYDQ